MIPIMATIFVFLALSIAGILTYTEFSIVTISITDMQSGAVTYWNPARGCCSVTPFGIPSILAQKEADLAKAFYGPTGVISIHPLRRGIL